MSNISRERIIETAANLSNKAGLENLSLKMIAEELKIKSPSLYNHVSSLDDIKKQLMLYGWKQIEKLTIEAAVGVTGYEALKNMCYAFYNYAINNKGIFTAMQKESFVFQENIIQNEQISKIYDKSINTIRIHTYLHHSSVF